MLRLTQVGHGETSHQACLADPERLAELREAFRALRGVERDPAPMEQFFAAHEPAYREVRDQHEVSLPPLLVKETATQVSDLLGEPPPAAPSLRDPTPVRAIGWYRVLDRMKVVAEMLRIEAPGLVVRRAREELQQAWLQALWREAPEPLEPIDFMVWRRPVRLVKGRPALPGMGPVDTWSILRQHARELMRRGLWLCCEPFAPSFGCGAHGAFSADGQPLIPDDAPAHAGWPPALRSPQFLVGADCEWLAHSVIRYADAPDDDSWAERQKKHLTQATRRAVDEHLAIVWWQEEAAD